MTHDAPKSEPKDPVGLCARCRHGRAVLTSRAVYLLCERSVSDPRYDKYPRLPVRECPGYEERGTEPG